MFGLNKIMATAAGAALVFSMGVFFGAGSAHAATTSICPPEDEVTLRQFTLTTENPISNSCYAWGDNNDSNDTAFENMRLSNFGAEHTLLSKVEYDDDVLQREGSNDSLLGSSIVDLLGGKGGKFSLDTSGFANLVLVFKTGLGNTGGPDGESITPGFAAFLLSPSGSTEGEWSVNQNQGLSHVSLYGSPAPIPLPAGGILLVTALGGLGIAARRRRKAG